MNDGHITVYIDLDGLVTVRMPKGVMPDKRTLKSVMSAIQAERRYHHDPFESCCNRGHSCDCCNRRDNCIAAS